MEYVLYIADMFFRISGRRFLFIVAKSTIQTGTMTECLIFELATVPTGASVI
jgi:hypothetical protein